ncbi:S-adenosylmethionine-dependent methyltransferase [Halobacteriovorax sp. BALOs_7]|uniref:class I SAM-dependent rRNA methyltransferase n=1 Tax=Halobacteriovorax sp. BALOs_7 TaxID=2109558 RepID=UPI000EA08139|nr:class I SAM-dependent methyltransferase [Halobacteriovorax sp. BALOs_7]AYF43155.1 S-adenosylmethionine-dependent methyltransferase [Halobacteriovorax sp. BALOs_7]
MRTINIKKKINLRFEEKVILLSGNDIEDSLKSYRPGEWCFFEFNKAKYIGFVNPNSSRKKNICVYKYSQDDPLSLIKNLIKNAVSYRKEIGYALDSRLIYGEADGLPGVIVDSYENCAIVQINSAGMDQFRNDIKTYLNELIDKDVLLLDNETYRKIEELPTFKKDDLPEVISVTENGFKYKIDRELMQKVGYYYDHRENRRKFEELTIRTGQSFKKGLDLFTYVGSWGLHLLRANVSKVDFVDQANMQGVVDEHLSLNNFSGKGTFIRSDVFKFLDGAINSGNEYDIIVCDPPAFSKNYKDKKAALKGYEKLYNKIFQIIENGGLLAAASCTQNISMSELDQCVLKAANKIGVSVKLIDTGIQGLDHPISNLDSRSNYIKYLAYKVDRNDR